MLNLEPSHLPLMLFAVVAAVSTMFMALLALNRMYTAFTAPVGIVTMDREGSELPVYRESFFYLLASYVGCALILAYTGGTIGMSIKEFSLQETKSHMLWGFSMGILVAALARISGVFLNGSLARYLQLLTVITIGIIVFKLVQGQLFLTELFDKHVQPAMGVADPGHGSYFPILALATVIVTCISVEVIVFLSKFLPKANQVPYSLLTERREQFSNVEQEFLPGSVVNFTEKKISEAIREQGLSEFSWLTHTAPFRHMMQLYEELRKKYDDQKAKELMATKVRIIICRKSSFDRFIGQLKTAPFRIPSVTYYDRPVPERKLIINRCRAIIHLTIPFRDRSDEWSNCAHFLNTQQCVEPLCREFDAMWAELVPSTHPIFMTVIGTVFRKLFQSFNSHKPNGRIWRRIAASGDLRITVRCTSLGAGSCPNGGSCQGNDISFQGVGSASCCVSPGTAIEGVEIEVGTDGVSLPPAKFHFSNGRIARSWLDQMGQPAATGRGIEILHETSNPEFSKFALLLDGVLPPD